MDEGPKIYDAHLNEYSQTAYIRGMEEYQELYQRSLEDPGGFWAQQAREYLTWQKEWDFVLREDFEQGAVEWFGGGVLNAAYNCLDRHLELFKNRVAYYWEGDDPGESEVVSYLGLFERVNKLAAVLKSRNIGRGDRVIIYMPMVVGLPVAMLACARIGAVHVVVFGGFSSEALAHRIRDCGACAVITVDGAFRGGKLVPLKKNVDEALKDCPDVQTVIVCNRTGLRLDLDGKQEIWWHKAVEDPSLPAYVEPEPMGAEDPLFIVFTSSSTGKPKGVVHTHGGYLLHAAVTTRLVFDLRQHETFWCTADIGWITGHSYGVYGPLLNGFSSVLFEGVPGHPSYDRFWRIISKYKVDKFYTAPSVIRRIASEESGTTEKYDISSLKLLGCVGEPINLDAWQWYYHHMGHDRCPIIDTWLQTESGGHMITPLPGVAPIKPGSCSLPFFGVDPVILDPNTGEEARFPNQEGVLCIRRAWPGMARTLYGDHERFVETYFGRVPGMYFTGDAARRDEDGYFWITGRIDDVVNVSGYRLGTGEVESVLILHKLVAEAAVVGFPHPVKGQGIYAFVTLIPGAPRSDGLKKELNNLVRNTIGPIATIDLMQWTDGLPKTRSGKIVRRVLQKVAAGMVEQLGDLSVVSNPEVLDSLVKDRLTAT